MASNDNQDFKNSNVPKITDSELGVLLKQLQVLNNLAGTTSLGASVSLAREGTLSNIFTRLQAIRAGDGSEPVTEQDDGPAEIATVTNLKAVSLGSAQILAAAPGASLKAQIRDLFVSVDTDCYVSIFSTSGTMFIGNLKASNGTIQLCPRQGFTTAGTNEAISMISTSASGTHNTTVNSVSV
jgi:hypothetical protein